MRSAKLTLYDKSGRDKGFLLFGPAPEAARAAREARAKRARRRACMGGWVGGRRAAGAPRALRGKH